MLNFDLHEIKSSYRRKQLKRMIRQGHVEHVCKLPDGTIMAPALDIDPVDVQAKWNVYHCKNRLFERTCGLITYKDLQQALAGTKRKGTKLAGKLDFLYHTILCPSKQVSKLISRNIDDFDGLNIKRIIDGVHVSVDPRFLIFDEYVYTHFATNTKWRVIYHCASGTFKTVMPHTKLNEVLTNETLIKLQQNPGSLVEPVTMGRARRGESQRLSDEVVKHMLIESNLINSFGLTSPGANITISKMSKISAGVKRLVNPLLNKVWKIAA